jgi:16S rRNA (guanine(966)-N(2))-methyltransferase RsmD
MEWNMKRAKNGRRGGAKALKLYRSAVIGGALKGKYIDIPALSTTRSSKSILRESLFNTLQYDIVGRYFVEVFAGSGSIAIEAVSRGAAKAWCIEKNPDVYEVLSRNVRRLADGKIVTLRGDSFELLPGILKELENCEEKAYFYFDPPFSIRENMEDIYDRTIAAIGSIEARISQAVIVEHMSRIELPQKIGAFTLEKKKRFGKSSLSYYTVESDE